MLKLIVPVYNGEAHLEPFYHYIHEFLGQIEICFIDDCSTDDTAKILNKLFSGFDNVTILTNENNLGIYKSRFMALKYFKSGIALFHDVDDTIDIKKALSLYGSDANSFDDTLYLKNLKYSKGNLISQGPFLSSPCSGTEAYYKTVGGWEIAPSCFINIQNFIKRFRHIDSTCQNIDEHVGRLNLLYYKTIVQTDVNYYYKIEGESISRTFSKKRLTYYNSYLFTFSWLEKNNYPIIKRKWFIDVTKQLKTDIVQIVGSKLSLLQQVKFLFGVLKGYINVTSKLFFIF